MELFDVWVEEQGRLICIDDTLESLDAGGVVSWVVWGWPELRVIYIYIHLFSDFYKILSNQLRWCQVALQNLNDLDLPK